VAIELRGRRIDLLLGDDVVIGRSEGAIVVPSQAVSRRHLRVVRTDSGFEARDLASRNGTELRGMRIGGPLAVPDEGLDLKLGGEVPVRIARADELHGAVAIEIGGTRYVAPLGPARLGIGAWRVERAADGWLELVTERAPIAHLRGAELGDRIPLLAGDAFADARGSVASLRVLA
jgi:hypothetical protein